MQKSVQDEVTAIQKRRLPTISESPITTPRGTNVAQIKEKVFSPRKPVGRSVSLGSQENVQETESSRIEIMQPTQVTKKEEKSDSKSAITLSEEGSKKPLQQEPVEKSKTIEEVAEIERQVIKEKVVVSEEELKVESEKLRVAKEKKQKLRKKMIGSPILLSPAKQSEPVEKSKKTEELAEKKRPQGAKRWTVSEKELKEGPEKLRLEKQKEQEEFVREKKLKTPTVLPYPTQPQSDTYEQVEDLPGKGGGEKTEPDEEPETPKLEEQETERKKTKENDNPVNPINTNVSKESSQSEQSSWTKDIQNWFIKVLKSIIDWGYSLFID